MIIMVVRFKSALPEQEVVELAKKHRQNFVPLKGLVQKYYIKDHQTGEYGGVYLWDSMNDLQQFQQSGLASRILSKSQLQGQPKIEVLEVAWTLRPE